MSVRVRHRAAEMHCLQNLTDLGKAMRMYANDYNGRYPTAGKWCDLLVEHAGIRERRLLCTESGGKRGDFYYAINQNTELNSPGDMVLLFEGYGGWNQFGGPERLTTGNHFPNRCNVLFNDGHAESVKKKQLGDLRWKVEEGDGVREGFFK
jgi:prepilin-type processing-associated H-X9-DG protein